MADDHLSAVAVFFLSDSTGISAETMGNALLIQFPDPHFERRVIPFISTIEEARRVVEILDRAMGAPVTPLAFMTTAMTEIRDELHRSTCPLIDFFDLHVSWVEEILQTKALPVAARLQGVGDVQRYNARMVAVEYAIEHATASPCVPRTRRTSSCSPPHAAARRPRRWTWRCSTASSWRTTRWFLEGERCGT